MMRLPFTGAAAGLLLVVASIVACSETTAEAPASGPAGTLAAPPTMVVASLDDTLPTRQQLYERFFETRQLLVVYGAADTTTEQAYRQMAQRSPGRWRTLPDLKRAEDVVDLAAGAVLLVGTPRSNPHIARIAHQLPVSFEGETFTFAGTLYDSPSDVLTLVFPNPENTNYPLFLITGNQDADVAAQGQGLLRMYDYQVVRNGKRIRLGHFSQESGRRWMLDPQQDFDLRLATAPIAKIGPIRIHSAPDAFSTQRVEALVAGREASMARLAGRLGEADTWPDVNYHLYPSLQQKALVTDDMRLSHLDPATGDVHVALQESIGLGGDVTGIEIASILNRVLGAPAYRAFEDGVRIAVEASWHGQEARLWAGRIAQAGLAPTLDDLLDEQRYAEFPALLREPVAAELAALLLEDPDWRNRYTDGFTPDERQRLAAALAHRLDEAADASGRQPLPAPVRPRPKMLKGFNFAHEGYGIVNGYGSRSAAEALAYTQGMGANAVTIIPYSFINDANVPQQLPIPTSAGSENDESVLHAVLEAKRLGLHVTIKPQIWLRGGWPGDIEMLNEADWETFFQHYERWIGHYAVMSELYGVDMLCVGTELSKTTLSHPDRWRTMTAEWRALYSGPMVYASNWGEEFENLEFWDAFDFIAVNSYYPICDKDAPSDRDLRKGAESAVSRLAAVHRRHNKPIIITEIGYPSTSMPWKAPWLENRELGAHVEDQARCYEAICRALDDQPWLRGIYWWKWPSYLDRGGPDELGFTPNGKPAADVVTAWFNAW
ncbi:MAG: hypothetical protein SH809_05575 [Rhodothermales bacterium]|nr:hypothetical protein [Rhodothermales bacterium]